MATSTRDRGVSPRQLVAGVVAIVALVFVFSNTGQMHLKFFGLTWTAPGWVMLLIIFLGGLVTGWFVRRRRHG